jgi:hypothetical protein
MINTMGRHYPEAVSSFSVNVGKEKLGKDTNFDFAEYLEEEEIRKLIEIAPTLQKKAFLHVCTKVEQDPKSLYYLLILI